MEYILKIVSDITGVPESGIMSEKRGKAKVSEARHFFMLACRSKGKTQEEIGSFIGRTHSDVSNGIKSIRGKIEIYKSFKQVFGRIMDAI
jgi:chromosomal replication initiation ATPase DnaA